MRIHFFISCFLFVPFLGIGQKHIDTTSYEYHLNLGQEYNLEYQFPESIKEIEIAIRIAKKERNYKKQLNAEISLAEVMRRTQNYRAGLDILYAQKKHKQYPKLYVRRLGRMAALYAEGDYFPGVFSNEINVSDSIESFLNEALLVSINNKFENEEASLRNELGLFLMRRDKRPESIPHLKKAAELYMKFGDTVNYVRPMIRLMENSMMISNDMQQFDSIAEGLLSLTNGKKWYVLQAELYKFVGSGCAHRGDSLGYYRWLLRSEQSSAEFNKLKHSEKLAAIEVRYDTQKFQKEAAESKLEASEKSKQLAIEEEERNKLLFLLIGLGVMLCGLALFIIREKKRKGKIEQANSNLQLANEKYEILMIESNHRIKNNLQMIISLLEYSSEDVVENGEKALKRISTKIETIGALHKHLNEHVHFEKVRVDKFFEEILNLYQSMSSFQLTIVKFVAPLEMKNERIVYLGLILNELLSNTIEHNQSEIKQVKVEVIPFKENYLFRYCDSSPLIESSVSGTGMVLIKKLIRRVGGKDFQIDKSDGSYEFKFNG